LPVDTTALQTQGTVHILLREDRLLDSHALAGGLKPTLI
jgi:hypothetical protein